MSTARSRGDHWCRRVSDIGERVKNEAAAVAQAASATRIQPRIQLRSGLGTQSCGLLTFAAR